jgi:hypothetical protein
MSDDTTERDPVVEEARDRMTKVAVGLAAKLGPLEAAGILAGAAAVVLSSALGPAAAADYLRQLAGGVEGEPVPLDCAGSA